MQLLDQAYRIAAMQTLVDLWVVGLDASDEYLRHSYRILSREEHVRGEKFRFTRDRTSFLTGRAVLREILAMYLEERACKIRLAYGPLGKPVLADPGVRSLHFNVAHSANLAVYAFSPIKELGVDIERVRTLGEFLPIAKEFFAPDEYKQLSHLPQSEQCEAFFRCWTRKEAYVKARGGGLFIPLDGFQVPLGTGQGLVPILQNNDYIEAERWFLLDVFPAKGYAAALAVGSGECLLTQRMFSNADECQTFLRNASPTGTTRNCCYEAVGKTFPPR